MTSPVPLDVRGYYAILDATPDALLNGEPLASRARALLAAGPCCLQLRAKGASAAAFLAAARRLQPLCRDAGVPLCVNDRLDVALAVGAEVVHLGQDDLPLADARAIRAAVGRPELVIGFSTHTLAQAAAAATGGADYIGFGPVFGTTMKLDPDATVGLAALAEVCRTLALPVVGIGGIEVATAAGVAAAGARAAAVISAVERSPDPTAAGRAVAAAFARA